MNTALLYFECGDLQDFDKSDHEPRLDSDLKVLRLTMYLRRSQVQRKQLISGTSCRLP